MRTLKQINKQTNFHTGQHCIQTPALVLPLASFTCSGFNLNATPLPFVHAETCDVYKADWSLLPCSHGLLPWVASLRVICTSILKGFMHVIEVGEIHFLVNFWNVLMIYVTRSVFHCSIQMAPLKNDKLCSQPRAVSVLCNEETLGEVLNALSLWFCQEVQLCKQRTHKSYPCPSALASWGSELSLPIYSSDTRCLSAKKHFQLVMEQDRICPRCRHHAKDFEGNHTK